MQKTITSPDKAHVFDPISDLALKSLRDSECRYRRLFEAARDGILLLNVETAQIEDVNPYLIEMLGYTHDEFLGKRLWEVGPFADFAQSKAMFAELQAKGYIRYEDLPLRTKTGEVIAVEFVSNTYDCAGIKVIQCNIRDITQRKQAEVELRIAASAFDSQEGKIITDASGVILRVNSAFTDSTGYTVEEAVGRTPRLLKSGRHDAAFYADMWKILLRDGKWEGEIWDRRKNGEVFPKWLCISAILGVDGLATHYVGAHFDITERKAAEDQLRDMAFYDPLTQLPNRRLLLDRLSQARASGARSGRRGAVLFIDLDNFKVLNDSLGHDKGDLLLEQVAQRLVTCVREGDTVARLGGDEFVVMLADLSAGAEEAGAQTTAVGEKVLSSLNQPYLLAGREHRSTPSIGVALFAGHTDSIEELLKHADIAMYESKRAGRNTLRFFDRDMELANVK